MAVHAIYESTPDDTIMLSAGSGVSDGGYPPMPLSGFGSRKNPGSQASFLLAKWDHQIEQDNAFQLTGYVNDFYASSGLSQVDYRYQQLALQFGHTFKPADDHTLTWGVDSRTDLVDASNSDPFLLSKDFVSTAIIGLYVQDEWRFAPRWTLNLGGRIDYEFYGGFEPSARASLSYELTENSLIYGAVSRAFTMPTAAARFLSLPGPQWVGQADQQSRPRRCHIDGLRTWLPRPVLRSIGRQSQSVLHSYDDETTFSTELGPPGLIQQKFDNRADAELYGVELDVKYAATKELTLLANYTFQELRWRSDVDYLDRGDISPPEHKFMLGARYSPTDTLHLSSHLYWVDAVKAPNPANPFTTRSVDPYFRWDLRAEYELIKDKASVAVGVRNLLDPNHYEGGTTFLNDAEVPRMVYAELRMRLD